MCTSFSESRLFVNVPCPSLQQEEDSSHVGSIRLTSGDLSINNPERSGVECVEGVFTESNGCCAVSCGRDCGAGALG